MSHRDKRLNLMLGVPSMGTWNAEFGMCLAMLMAHLMAVQIPGTKGQTVRLSNMRGSLISKSREELIHGSLEAGMDYLMFLDSDQTFPRDIVHRFYAWKKPIVAANIATKQLPSQPTARVKDDRFKQGRMLYSDPGMVGIEEVWRIGTGLMLINLKALKQHLNPPNFEIKYRDGHYVGEDWGFCEKMEKAGIKLYVDHGASREVGHIGSLEYTHDLMGEVIDAQDEVQSTEEAQGFGQRQSGLPERREQLSVNLPAGE